MTVEYSIKNKLLGENIKIISSNNKTLEGIEGKVVFDSKNTIVLSSKDKEITLLKSSIIELAIPEKGIAINFRKFAENKKTKNKIKKQK